MNVLPLCLSVLHSCVVPMEVRTRILEVLGMVSSPLRAAVFLSIELSLWPFKDFFFLICTQSIDQ